MTNKTKQRDEQIINRCLKTVQSLPGFKIETVSNRMGGAFAGSIKLTGEWGEKYYFLKVVPTLSPAMADLVIHQLKTTAAPANCSPLLLTHYISPNLAAKLKQKRIEYADCAGNLLLHQSPLYVEISGQKHLTLSGGLGRLFRPAGLKLIYLFLRNPQAVNATYRVLADDAGVALGAIGDLIKELENRGNLLNTATGRELIDAEELLQRWQLGYVETLRPRMFMQRCTLDTSAKLQDLPKVLSQSSELSTVMLGGQLGASLLSGSITPESAVLYCAPQLQQRLIQTLHLTPDPQGELSLMTPFGKQNLWHHQAADAYSLVDPLLLYAELACDGLSAKGADMLYTKHLIPRLNKC